MTQHTLPSFKNPPLHEVAISVQFEPIDDLLIPHLGRLWEHYRDRFPNIEQHPPLENIIERTGAFPISRRPRFEIFENPPSPRLWFVDGENRELLQLQKNRFIRNWRKISANDVYPRYEDHIRQKFLDDIGDFLRFIDAENLGSIVPNQCEVSYINHIYPNECWQSHEDIAKVFRVGEIGHDSSDELPLESMNIFLRKKIFNEKREFIGRLHAKIESSYDVVLEQPLFMFELIARGAPGNEDIDSVMEFIDVGRAHIVRTFTQMTTPIMHSVWGLENGE